MTLEQLETLVKNENEKFIANRALQEKEISDTQERLKLVDPEIIKELSIDIENFTAKKLLPSLYQERFVKADYDREQKAVIDILQKLDNKRNELLAMAEKLIGGVPNGNK